MNGELKIGICGITCGKCPEYTAKRCPGCRPNEICPLPACAKERGLDFCFQCKDFPCKLNYEKGPIVSELLDYWKGKKPDNE